MFHHFLITAVFPSETLTSGRPSVFKLTCQSCLFYSSGRNKERELGDIESRYLELYLTETEPTLCLYYETCIL